MYIDWWYEVIVAYNAQGIAVVGVMVVIVAVMVVLVICTCRTVI